MIESAPKTISQIGIIFCMEHFLKLIAPTTIMVTGMAIKIISMTVIVIEQKKNAPSRFNSMNVPRVVSRAYATLLNIVDEFGFST